MKKIYYLSLCIFSIQCVSAQNLAGKIPANANAVATINAGKLTTLLPVEEWEKTVLGKKFKEMQEKDSSISFKSLNDLGLNLTGNIYYFHTEDDSMHYNTALLPIADASRIDKLLGKKELIRLANNVRKVTEEDSSGVFTWNNDMLVYVNASIKDAYFRKKEVAENHGLSAHDSYYEDYAVVADTAMVVESIMMDTSVVDTAAMDSVMTAAEDAMDTVDSTVEIMDEEEAPYESTFDYYNDLSIKKRISAACATFTANEIFYKTPAATILQNSSFVSANRSDAVASVWIDRPMDMYYRMMPYNYFYVPASWNNPLGNPKSGYKSFSSYLTMSEKQMNLHAAIEMSAEFAAIQEKIMDRKINKKFYKYINTDSMLGYMSWAFNTKNYLQQFPAMMEQTYTGLGLGVGAEEYNLAAEFFSFLIDEEAIDNMIKGDMMVLFDGVFQQETTYTDYTYNDDFEQTAVEKTKNETLPRFLMMASSKENNLAKKLIKYGINKAVVKVMDGFYEIEVPKSPMRFYFMYKDDIFFLTNSLQNIQGISTGTFKSNISKDDKKFIGNHNMSLFMNPANIASELTRTEIGATDDLTTMINTFKKMGPVRMKLNPIKNNISSTDLWMDVPAGNTNALSLLFSFFEGMIK